MQDTRLEGGCYSLQRSSRCILQPQPTGQWEEYGRLHIHSYKSPFMVEKSSASQEYHCRWRKIYLIWQFSTQKPVNTQGWIFKAYSKSRASSKEICAVCLEGSPRYYFLWVFFNSIQNLNKDLFSQLLQRIHEIKQNTPHLPKGKTLYFLITKGHIQQE